MKRGKRGRGQGREVDVRKWNHNRRWTDRQTPSNQLRKRRKKKERIGEWLQNARRINTYID